MVYWIEYLRGSILFRLAKVGELLRFPYAFKIYYDLILNMEDLIRIRPCVLFFLSTLTKTCLQILYLCLLLRSATL